MAKPVMGTSVPAPARRASLWYMPSPVASAERNTSVTDVAVPASAVSSPPYQWDSSWPTTQMAPPTRKASAVFLTIGDGGDICFTSA